MRRCVDGDGKKHRLHVVCMDGTRASMKKNDTKSTNVHEEIVVRWYTYLRHRCPDRRITEPNPPHRLAIFRIIFVEQRDVGTLNWRWAE